MFSRFLTISFCALAAITIASAASWRELAKFARARENSHREISPHHAAESGDPSGGIPAGATVTRTFDFRNVTSEPLTLEKPPRTSCGCTAAHVAPEHLLPGQACEITLTVATGGKIGHVEETAEVAWRTPSGATVSREYTVSGEIVPGVTAYPSPEIVITTAAGAELSPVLLRSSFDVDWTRATATISSPHYGGRVAAGSDGRDPRLITTLRPAPADARRARRPNEVTSVLITVPLKGASGQAFSGQVTGRLTIHDRRPIGGGLLSIEPNSVRLRQADGVPGLVGHIFVRGYLGDDPQLDLPRQIAIDAPKGTAVSIARAVRLAPAVVRLDIVVGPETSIRGLSESSSVVCHLRSCGGPSLPEGTTVEFHFPRSTTAAPKVPGVVTEPIGT